MDKSIKIERGKVCSKSTAKSKKRTLDLFVVSCARRTLYQATGRTILILHVCHSLHNIWLVCSPR